MPNLRNLGLGTPRPPHVPVEGSMWPLAPTKCVPSCLLLEKVRQISSGRWIHECLICQATHLKG